MHARRRASQHARMHFEIHLKVRAEIRRKYPGIRLGMIQQSYAKIAKSAATQSYLSLPTDVTTLSSFHCTFGCTVASFAFTNCIFRDFANAFLPSRILDIFVTIDEVTKVHEMYFIPYSLLCDFLVFLFGPNKVKKLRKIDEICIYSSGPVL